MHYPWISLILALLDIPLRLPKERDRTVTEVSIRVLKERQDAVRNNWGFIFALACATLWGTCYQGIGFISEGNFFGASSLLSDNPYLSGFCLALFLTLCVCLASLVWLAFNGQLREWLSMIRTFNSNNLLTIICALCGGIAAWSTYVIAFSIDATFSVIIVMFYPAIGMLISKRWLDEYVSKSLYLGLAFIVVGWVILYLPQIVASQSADQLPIYLIGALAGVCWGIEGVLANRVMETVDSTVTVAVRYSYESLFMVVIAVLIALISPDLFAPSAAVFSGNPALILVILSIVGICLTVNYFSWYKSFTLCGVSRGLAVSDISGFITVIVSMLLLTSVPSWPAVVACVFMCCGVFIIYNDSTQSAALLRNVLPAPLLTQTALETPSLNKAQGKMYALVLVAQQGPSWDYEIAAELLNKAGKQHKDYRAAKRARAHLIEAAAIGIVVPVEYAIDTGEYFGEGKLLTRYALTEYGNERLVAALMHRR